MPINLLRVLLIDVAHASGQRSARLAGVISTSIGLPLALAQSLMRPDSGCYRAAPATASSREQSSVERVS